MISTGASPIVAYCLEHGHRALTVAEVARHLGLNRKTLLNRLAAARLSPPGAVISLCRLLHATRLLEDPRRSAESVALALHFSSAAHLRAMYRRYTGLHGGREVREKGGLRYVLDLLKRELDRRLSASAGALRHDASTLASAPRSASLPSPLRETPLPATPPQ
ncbi:MAG: helix-turn-helix domain-containing protein [Gemmatimonadaceae bacterium]